MQEPYEIIESYLAGNERSLRHDHKRNEHVVRRIQFKEVFA